MLRSGSRDLPRLLRRCSWSACLGAGVILFIALRAEVADTGNPNLVPSLILVGAVTVPCAATVFVADRLRPITVSGTAILVTAVAGGLTGIMCSGLIEYDASERGALTSVSVAVIEETVKLIAPLLFVLFTRRAGIQDGLVIAVASSAAFAALETAGYAGVLFIRHPHLTELDGLDNVLLWRGLLSPAGHIAWTAACGTALWWAAQRGWAARAVARFIAVFALCITLHAIWDQVDTLTGYLILSGISLPLFSYTVRRARIGAAMQATEHCRQRSGATIGEHR